MPRTSIYEAFPDVRRQPRGSRPKKVANNTWHHYLPDGSRALRLHRTDIVKIDSVGNIRLDSGGWHSATTKNRIDQAIRPYGFCISQTKGEWFVYRIEACGTDWDNPIPFRDDMLLLK